MRLALVLPLAALASPAVAAAPEDGALNAVYQRLAAARAAGDVAGMADAFGAPGILVDQRPGPALAGSELAARLAPMAARLKTENATIATAYRVERRSVIGEIALDAGFMRQTIERPGAEPMTRYARFLVTMQRGRDGTWRIIGDASMPATEAQWTALARSGNLHFDA